jgi:hypothetical protein
MAAGEEKRVAEGASEDERPAKKMAAAGAVQEAKPPSRSRIESLGSAFKV